MDKKKSCCNLYQSVLPVFSSKHFIMSVIMFRSLICLSLFLCVVLGSVLIPFFHMKLSNLLSITYWRGFLFSIVYSCLLCHRWGDHRGLGLSLGSLPWSMRLCFCFCASTILSWWLQLCSGVWSQGGDSSSSVFLSQDCFDSSGSFVAADKL